MSAYLRLLRQNLSRADALLAADKTSYVGVGILVPKPLTSPAEVATRVPTNGVLRQTLSTAALLIPSEAATNT